MSHYSSKFATYIKQEICSKLPKGGIDTSLILINVKIGYARGLGYCINYLHDTARHCAQNTFQFILAQQIYLVGKYDYEKNTILCSISYIVYVRDSQHLIKYLKSLCYMPIFQYVLVQFAPFSQTTYFPCICIATSPQRARY